MTENKKQIGFVGCGVMGKGMIKNLIKNGYSVCAYDVNQESLKEATDYGAIPSSSVEDLASKSNILMTSLPNPEVLRGVIDKAIPLLPKYSWIVDLSTTDLETTKILDQQAQECSQHFFDCPLSGGPEGAEKGALTVMAGGSATLFPELKHVLQAIGESIYYIGEAGSGQIVKLCNNFVVAGTIALLSEAFIVGEQAGVPKEKIAEIMENGSASSKVLSVFGPNILDKTYDQIIFQLNHMEKDISMYQYLHRSNDNSLVSSTIHDLYGFAKNSGKGGLDTTAIGEYLEEKLRYEASS